jgi:hypothetical protein
MKQVTLSLADDTIRPVIRLKEWNNVRALLDTGALYPVWVAGESTLIKYGGVYTGENVRFGGFGGMTDGKLYEVNIAIGELIFPRMSIILCNDIKNPPYQLVLSAYLFKGLIYTIDDKNHSLIINTLDNESLIRNFKITTIDNRLQVLSQAAQNEAE